MICASCGQHFRKSLGPSLSICTQCYERSRSRSPASSRDRQRRSADVPSRADPKPQRFILVVDDPLTANAADESPEAA
jgi:hypothetical protein